nr:adenosine deaminase [Galbitalea soli]
MHCHFTGSVDARTAVELARRYGVALPDDRGADTLYDHPSYEDLGRFLEVYDIVGSCIRTVDDFRRVSYEVLMEAARHTVLYREMFVSPASHAFADYPTMLEGILLGAADAEADSGIVCRIIPAIHREHSVAEARELVELVVEHRRDEVIGIGLDYEEAAGPPHPFAEVFQFAKRKGLHRTAHSESGPPAHIPVLLDALGCERIDHGYHVIQDQRILERVVAERVPFTCTPVSSDIGRYSGSGDGTHETIRAMVDAGVAVTIDSDDPPMFGTDATNDFRVLHETLGYGADQLLRFTRTALEAAWLDAGDRAALGRRVDALAARLP